MGNWTSCFKKFNNDILHCLFLLPKQLCAITKRQKQKTVIAHKLLNLPFELCQEVFLLLFYSKYKTNNLVERNHRKHTFEMLTYYSYHLEVLEPLLHLDVVHEINVLSFVIPSTFSRMWDWPSVNTKSVKKLWQFQNRCKPILTCCGSAVRLYKQVTQCRTDAWGARQTVAGSHA